MDRYSLLTYLYICIFICTENKKIKTWTDKMKFKLILNNLKLIPPLILIIKNYIGDNSCSICQEFYYNLCFRCLKLPPFPLQSQWVNRMNLNWSIKNNILIHFKREDYNRIETLDSFQFLGYYCFKNKFLIESIHPHDIQFFEYIKTFQSNFNVHYSPPILERNNYGEIIANHPNYGNSD